MSVSRIARVRKVVEELEALGVERRCAKAVGSMVGVNLDKISKTASRPLLEDALRRAASSPVLDLLLSDSVDNAPSMLCGDLAVKWAKTAKGGGKTTTTTMYTGGNCFLGPTPISTPVGDISIEDLRAGDKVLAFDPTTGELSERPLVAVTGPLANKKHLRVQLGDADIFCTSGHPFLTPEGFVKAGKLHSGSRVVLANNTHQEIETISSIVSEAPVYNLQVGGVQTFVAQGVVVHNTTIAPDGRVAWKMAKDYEDEDDAEEIARQEERELAEKTVKLGYCVARHLGFDSATSLFAGVYAFTKL